MRRQTTRFGPPDRDPVGVSRSGAGTMMGSDAVVALNLVVKLVRFGLNLLWMSLNRHLSK